MDAKATGKIYMPLTFPGHQGLILPVARKWPHRFDALALSVGAAIPDITDSLLGFTINGYFKQWYGHTLLGIFTLDLLIGLLITWLATVLAARLLQSANLPQWWQTFLTKAPSKSDAAVGKNMTHHWQTRLNLWSFSVMVGVLSHIGFDLISHDKNFLLYPWYDNIRWLPEWWYAVWFKIPPLPLYNHSYSVGIHTVVWGILSLIGVLLFCRFLSPKNEIESRKSIG